MSSAATPTDLTETRSFLDACLDESQHDTLRRMVERLDPALREWAGTQYKDLDAMAAWPSVLESALAAGPLPPGLVCEFGVCTGNSTNLIARMIAPRTVFGFDWFEGLPHDWLIGHIRIPKGFLAIDPSKVNFEPNVRVVRGSFCESLPPFLDQHPSEPVAFLHIDCDTYQSTKVVLTHTSSRFQLGTVIVFDEVLGDMGMENELKAFQEMLHRKRFGFEWMGRGGHCWTADTQARYKAIKKNDFVRAFKFAVVNLNSIVGFLRNGKKVEEVLSAAALRITALP